MSKPRRKVPTLYYPFKSWKQAGIAYCLGFTGLSLFYALKSFIQR
jgi:hypothetical protein